MTTFVSRDLQSRLDAATGLEKARVCGLRLVAQSQTWPILRKWDTGVALSLEDAPQGLRGFVDIYDGDTPLFQCLIVANELVGKEVHFAFKRMTAIRSEAARDFVETQQRPAAYIPDMR